MSGAVVVLLFVLALALGLFGGVLSAIDAAHASLSRTDLEDLAEEHPKTRKQLLAIAADRDQHVSAVNFVSVMSETFAAVLITVAFAELFSNVWLALIVAVAAMTVISFILVGVSPRMLGGSHASRIARSTAALVRTIRILLGPIARGLSTIGAWVAEGRQSTDDKEKNDQLFSMVDLAAEQELLEEDEQEIIHSVVEFSDTSVREVMVPRTDMVTVESTSTIREAFDLLLNSRHSRVPVISGDTDDISGVIHLRDVAWFVHRKPEVAETSSVTRVMKPAKFVPDLQRADDLFRQMQREANHLALVFDEYGGIAGLVTMEDLIEELVGEIHDEHDREEAIVQELDPGVYRVSSRFGIEDLGELFDRELSEDDAQTVGGLVAKQLGRLAEEGDVAVVSGIELEVLKVDRKRRRMLEVQARWIGEPDPTTGSLELPNLATDDSEMKEEQHDR